jgi:predicted cupin superfamily sugar epimerase
MITVEDLVRLYGFEPLPVEGGMYKQTYRAAEVIPHTVLPDRYTGDKPFGTAILYLYTSDDNSFSAMHKLPTDEIYHFYLGDPVELLQLYPDERSEHITLGQNVLAGQKVQYVAPRGVWMGSHMLPGGTFALIGTTMAPGFTNDDYVGGAREMLIRQYPREKELIVRLTRAGEALRMPRE